MKNFNKLAIFLILLVLSGCNSFSNNSASPEGLPGKQPPNIQIQVSGKDYKTIIGSYCWDGTCVDKVGPQDLVKGETPIPVQGDKINFVMYYSPKPDDVHLKHISSNGKAQDIKVTADHFTAPKEKGVYLYSYDVLWPGGESPANPSKGSASYAFVLEVK